MPKVRPRRRTWSVWPFGRRRNRRVKPPSLPGIPVRRRPAARLPWRRIGVVLALAGVLSAGAWGAHRFVTRSSPFSLAQVRFSTTRHVSTESLQARVGVALGTNLFAIDLDEVARDVLAEPWIARARARRELPNAITIDVVERQAACVVALGALYLADAEGQLFKRATPDEAAALPVVTGLDREQYLADPLRAQANVREALSVASAWALKAGRPPLGELHVDLKQGTTAYTQSGVGVRLGRIDATLADRLQRFDAVWAALEDAGERARLIFLDNRARPDRVTVKLLPGATPKKSET